ncbi:hypothetical protein ACFQH6_09290 [Halobacteriaceae archaeon GCM10025711]
MDSGIRWLARGAGASGVVGESSGLTVVFTVTSESAMLWTNWLCAPMVPFSMVMDGEDSESRFFTSPLSLCSMVWPSLNRRSPSR